MRLAGVDVELDSNSTVPLEARLLSAADCFGTIVFSAYSPSLDGGDPLGLNGWWFTACSLLVLHHRRGVCTLYE